MMLASQFATREQRFIARAVATLRAAVQAGHSIMYTFDKGEPGWTRLDVMGPKGLRPCSGQDAREATRLDRLIGMVEPLPTVRLWSPMPDPRPIALATANRRFPSQLDAIARRAQGLVGEEYPILLALLAVVREEVERMRFRAPLVGDGVTGSGRPSALDWAAALSPAAFQAALSKSAS